MSIGDADEVDEDDNDSQSNTKSTTSVAGTETSSRNSMLCNFLDKITDEQKENLDELLARAVYSSGCPLSITENPYWTQFFKVIRPSYKLPSRNQLANSLLDKEFRNVKDEITKKIGMSNTIGLQCDGWSNIRNQAIINFILTTPKSVLFKTTCTDSKRHTGEFMSDEMIKIIEEIGCEKFIGVVTDNAAAMEKAKSLLTNKYNFIYGYSCVSHTLNLLVGDIMKLNSLRNIEVLCKQIVKEVTSSHVTLAQFNKIQTQNNGTVLSLKLPVKTRWGSILNCINSLLACKNALQILMVSDSEHVKFSKNVKQNCLDNEIFWVKLKKVALILTPIVKWITLLEGDKFRISQIVVAFKDIKNNFDKFIQELPILKAEETEFLSILLKRENMALKPLHYAANLLDPSFVGEYLNNKEHLSAMEFIHTLINNHPQFIDEKEAIFSELANYCAKTDLWAMDFIWSAAEKVDRISWWQGLCQKTNLKNVAIAILGLPASSAATKRSFSTYAFIHNKKRNRLTTNRAGMLIYIAHNNKLLHKNFSSFGNKHALEQQLQNIYKSPMPTTSKQIKLTEHKNDVLINSDSESEKSDFMSLHDTISSIGEEFSDLESDI